MKYKYFLTVWLFSYFCESQLFPYGISYIGLLAVISCNDHCLCCVNNTIHLSQSCTTSGNPMTGRQRRTIFTKLRVSSTCGGGGGGNKFLVRSVYSNSLSLGHIRITKLYYGSNAVITQYCIHGIIAANINQYCVCNVCMYLPNQLYHFWQEFIEQQYIPQQVLYNIILLTVII